MELLLSKSQKSGLMGGITFILHIKTKLTEAEQALVKKYKMGDEVVYEKLPVMAVSAGLGGIAGTITSLTAKALKLVFTVNDLVKGRTIECKDILDMIAAEAQIRDAADAFWTILVSATDFEGEEVITYPRPAV